MFNTVCSPGLIGCDDEPTHTAASYQCVKTYVHLRQISAERGAIAWPSESHMTWEQLFRQSQEAELRSDANISDSSTSNPSPLLPSYPTTPRINTIKQCRSYQLQSLSSSRSSIPSCLLVSFPWRYHDMTCIELRHVECRHECRCWTRTSCCCEYLYHELEAESVLTKFIFQVTK